jgi:hypothetical protein
MPKKNNYTCDKCGKKATHNLQNVWISYSIENDEEFIKDDEWEGDGNEFFCDECFENEV